MNADEAIQAAGDAACLAWKTLARRAVVYTAKANPEGFTTDSIWALLDEHPKPKEPRALGAIMRQLSKSGLIASSGEFRRSSRPECHSRPVMVWRLNQ